MKIAYLCNIYPAPTHTFIRREIKGVEQEGIQVKRISIRRTTDDLPSPEDIEELAKTFLILERGPLYVVSKLLIVGVLRPIVTLRAFLRTFRLGWRSQAGILRHVAYLAEACVVLEYSRKEDFMHIHAHFGTNAATVALMVRWLGGPTYSISIHGPIEWDCPEFIHIPEKVENAEFVSAISDFAKSQIYKWTSPDQWPKVHVIRCGVDEGFMSYPASGVPNVSEFLVVGRLGRSKGHVILLDALTALASEGLEFHVTLIGDGPMSGLIAQRVVAYNLARHVEMVGWQDNNLVREAIAASRAVVLPSFAEGLPVVLMEALALARPVICTRIAGIGELVVDGQSGWLVNAGNVDELATALREALATPVEVLSQMGEAGRAVVLEKHNSVVEAKKLAQLMRSTITDQ